MAEYIEKKDAKATIKRRLGKMDLFESLFNADIDAMPAADVAPVVHGRWIKYTTDGENMFGEPIEIVFACSCSVCGLDGRWESNYCPNCGARMDGE